MTGLDSGMQPRRERPRFLVRDPATAGLPRRDAVTTGLDGIFDESNVLELGSVPSCTPAAAEPAGVATERSSGPAGPTPTDSWPAAGAATSLAIAWLMFMLCRSGPCVCVVCSALGPRLFKHERKACIWCFAASVFRGVVQGAEGDSH